MTTRSLARLLLCAVLAIPASLLPAQEMHHTKGEPSTSLQVTGLDGKATTYTLAELKSMPHKTVSVYNEHTKKQESYAGVPLTDLLARAGAPTGEKLRGKGFLLYVIAEGTDHYRVVYSIDETDPANHQGEVLVADTLDGAPIADDGALKLISTEDKRPARWVRNLSAIVLKSAE